jgi:3-methyladenine DNA glycosylase AlkD
MKKKPTGPPAAGATAPEVLAWLERAGTKRQRDEMARYGIVAPRAFGVSVGTLLKLAKRLGHDHALAAGLWKSGWYEARLLAAMVDDPAQVTRAQMNAWAAAFDSWAVCDTVCFHLFDRTPFAWEKARAWQASPREFVKRAGFVMMAGQAGRDKDATDAKFLALLPLIEKGARDERNFVKKGVNWALRRIGRRNRALNEACVGFARRLAESDEPSVRWVGKDALRELTGPTVRAQLARRGR